MVEWGSLFYCGACHFVHKPVGSLLGTLKGGISVRIPRLFLGGIIMLLVLTAMFSGLAFAANPPDQVLPKQFTWNCEDPQWVGTPAMGTSGRLEVTISSNCKIVLGAAGSIEALTTHFKANLATSERTINSGPTAETYFKDLPGVGYDATNKTKDEGDSVTFHEKFHIASDATHFLSVSESAKIEGSGNAAYLKFLKWEDTVLKDSAENTFQYKVTETLHIEKPWYAPKDIFVSQATKRIKARFTKDLKVLNESRAKELVISTN